MSLFNGRLFTPRGLSGLNNVIFNELKNADGRMRVYNETEIQRIHHLDILSRVRIPQSIWVPLVDESVDNLSSLGRALRGNVEWSKIPPLKSHGTRITVSKDNHLFAGKENAILQLIRSLVPKGLHANEMSLRIGSDNRVSMQMNVIPPRPWIKTPMELMNISGPQWWSSGNIPVAHPQRPSEDVIKIFRNESSLSCLCAALIYSSPLSNQLANQSDVLVWDPFVGNGSVLMETIQFFADRVHEKKDIACNRLTIVGNVAAKTTASEIHDRIIRYVNASDARLTVCDKDSFTSQAPIKRTGRKSRHQSNNESSQFVLEDDNSKNSVHSIILKTGNRTIDIQLLSTPFESVFPYINGACILSHIPKSYNELLGIDKRELGDWSSFGNWIRSAGSQRSFSISVLAETNGFFKYSKLKFSRLIHLKSPTGKPVGSISRWTGL